MNAPKGKLPSLSAALAGITGGIERAGPWCGRRQLLVKFAEEAETATIYTADALRGEMTRLAARSRYHSMAIVGRDSLAEADFLAAAFPAKQDLPLMLDHDGQRPGALEKLLGVLELVQVSLDGTEGATAMERACTTIALAASKQVKHAVVLTPGDAVSDGPLLRIVEQVHEASGACELIVHPVAEAASEFNRRWALWLQQAMGVHGDVRIIPRWPAASR
jgi:hypothetical protein